MKLSFYVLLGVMAAGISADAVAGDRTTGGVIHFQGQIVEPPCEVTNTSRDIAVTCQREGKTWTLHRALGNAPQQEIVHDLFDATSLEYLNPQRTLAVYTLQYR
ncbi:type 1 fimbrial protein [Superficieibacter sp. HKU1]|uniref:type 1 fimbrial protein n=1 Tax=Superficieibacter sp. HKU1 TaxID=3031919 RepID=UPI0023E2FD7F|nr:type 1 fimbrial protein [Superficieibacter sp. HKU1]WES70133.1 type 1 fimbrial protein [Superficieibacter sp. HKU1]